MLVMCLECAAEYISISNLNYFLLICSKTQKIANSLFNPVDPGCILVPC